MEQTLEDAVQPGSHVSLRPVRERHRGCVEETPPLNRFPFSLKPITKGESVCTLYPQYGIIELRMGCCTQRLGGGKER